MGLMVLCACATAPTKERNQVLNEVTARKYASAWAKKVGANIDDLARRDEGDFFGQLGSLGFEYLARENTLVVRAYIFPRSTSFTSQPKLLPLLNRIAAEDPDSVSNGKFEVCKAPWEPDKQPSLFLRIDLKDGSQSESSVISRLVKLREDAMLWHRAKLTEVLDDLAKKEQQEQRVK